MMQVFSLEQCFSYSRVPQNPLEGCYNCPHAPPVFDLVGLGGLRRCISNKFPEGTDAVFPGQSFQRSLSLRNT